MFLLVLLFSLQANRVSFTNRNWTVDGHALESELHIERVRLINDFVANGYGILTLDHQKEYAAFCIPPPKRPSTPLCSPLPPSTPI